jgi:hypothetical protein
VSAVATAQDQTTVISNITPRTHTVEEAESIGDQMSKEAQGGFLLSLLPTDVLMEIRELWHHTEQWNSHHPLWEEPNWIPMQILVVLEQPQ